MITIIKEFYNQFYKFLISQNPFTWVYGVARTFLAVCLLLTLIFNDMYAIYDFGIFHTVNNEVLFSDLNAFYLLGWENLNYTKFLVVVILLMAASGFYPRYTGVLQWYVTISFFYSATITEGGDQINLIITFLLIPVTLLDNRKWHWDIKSSTSENKNFVGNLMFILISIQMAVLYLNAVTDKMYAKTEEWKLGNAFYYYLKDSYFCYPDWMDPLMNSLLGNSIFVSSLTWGTILFELILFGVLFSNKKVKYAIFPLAVLFHFGIAVFIGLVSFFFAMLGGLVIYLIPKDLKKETITTVFKLKRDWNVERKNFG